MNKFKIVLLSALGFLMVAVFSCRKSDFSYNSTTTMQPCKDIACSNGGYCDNGNCVCPDGFEGVLCENKWNARFVGSYTGTDECNPNKLYVTTITANTLKPNGIVIQDIDESCSTALSATIGYDKTSFNIPVQRTCDSIYVSGKGTHTLDRKYINIFLTKRDSINHSTEYCSVELLKN